MPQTSQMWQLSILKWLDICDLRQLNRFEKWQCKSQLLVKLTIKILAQTSTPSHMAITLLLVECGLLTFKSKTRPSSVTIQNESHLAVFLWWYFNIRYTHHEIESFHTSRFASSGGLRTKKDHLDPFVLRKSQHLQRSGGALALAAVWLTVLLRDDVLWFWMASYSLAIPKSNL